MTRHDERAGPRLLAALATAIALIPPAAHAALGGDAASIAADEARLRAARSVAQGPVACTIHELALPSGTAVREYVSPAGRVFAVAWRGPTLPDLRRILGEGYWQAFLGRPQDGRPRTSRTLRQPGLVVESAGHGRFFSGRAYVPDLVPEGFRVEDIR